MPSKRAEAASVLSKALDLADLVDQAPSVPIAGRRLLGHLKSIGACSLFVGSFPRLPATRLPDIVRGRRLILSMPVSGWAEAYAAGGYDHGNPVILAPLSTTKPFRWSEGGLPRLRGWAGMNMAKALGVDDGIAIPCHRPGNRVGVVSIGFERLDLDPADVQALHLAALAIYERLEDLVPADRSSAAALSQREIDCLSYVAEGLSDAEIGRQIGIGTGTVHTHVENAKRKLSARTRAHAVAKLLAGTA